VVGAKIFLILLNGLIVLVVWKISGIFSEDQRVRFATVLAVSIGLPLIPASNQVYPNMLGGLICLNALYWILTLSRQRPVGLEVFYAVSIALLPWLHIVFTAAALILAVALVFLIFVGTKDFRRVMVVIVPFFLSLGTLALYNNYAFGNPFGPYQSGSLEISKTALMVLLGLHFDQNQGFLLQNPVFFIGILSIGGFFAHNRRIGFLVALVYLSLIVPYALHTNWYGGWSFSGRFEWAAASILMVPTIFGMTKLASSSRPAFWLIAGIVVLLQAVFYIKYTFLGVNLYNKVGHMTWLDSYSIFYFPLHKWLPALYNVNWAYQYLPNLVFFLIIAGLLVLGFVISRRTNDIKKIVLAFCAGAVVFVLIAGFFSKPVLEPLIFNGDNLSSQTGGLQNGARIAFEGIDKPGFVTYGPYVILRKGSYRCIIYYSSRAPDDRIIGKWDIFRTDVGSIRILKGLFALLAHRQVGDLTEISATVDEGALFGTDGQTGSILVPFDVESWLSSTYEFRNFWNGSGDIRIIKIELQHQ
jgi:hypothetical protein